MQENIILIQLKTGEIVLTKTEDTDPIDDTNFSMLDVNIPAILMPIPQQPNRVGFQPYFPFSDLEENQQIRKSQIVTLSKPNKQMKEAYENWVTQIKAHEAGIIVPNNLDTTLNEPKQ